MIKRSFQERKPRVLLKRRRTKKSKGVTCSSHFGGQGSMNSKKKKRKCLGSWGRRMKEGSPARSGGVKRHRHDGRGEKARMR